MIKDKKDIIAIACVVFVCGVAVFLLQPKDNAEAPPVIEAPEAPVPEEEMQGPFDYLVKVTAHNPGDSHVGVGSLVTYDGYTFVLTSKMIFTPSDTHYTVTTTEGEQYPAMMLEKDDRRGLVALAVANGEFEGIEVNEYPNIPPDVKVIVRNLEKVFIVNVIRYLTDPDWLMLDGDLPGTCTGAPIVTSDSSLAGVVIGVNTEHAEEAFAVGNHAIRTFAEAVVNPEFEAIIGPPVFSKEN